VRYRIGIWGSDEEGESSNFKEFENIVATVEEEATQGDLKGAHLFLFTDNSTVESALYRGNSTSKKLFHLVVRLRKVEMDQGATVTVCHVAGKRMIRQGTDGVSRGQLKEGVTIGESMLSFVPFHLTSFERHPPLKDWISGWFGSDAEFLEPKDWFERGHGMHGGDWDPRGFWRPLTKPGKFVWCPPPGAAEVAMEELRRSLIKRQDSTHLFICPKLLGTEWRKQLFKAADLVFSIPPNFSFWPTEMFEPLTIGICFPFLSSPPWQLRGTPKLLYLGRTMPRVWEDEKLAPGDFLFQLCRLLWGLRSMPKHVVRRLLYFR
jgi:hypothetical protein